MRGEFRHTISQHKRWTSSGNSETNCLLFMVTLWIGKTWRSGAMNSPKEGLMFTTNKGVVGHLWSLMTFFRWQTSMTWGYRSWFQDLICVWAMPATMLKN